ncbi:hypothetical protein DPMN_050680 [Dreissena polymorpha]|uniref:Uncharacterized protein n=1 Tax=Dreissena polymorpha TaxID=45954 RepID=A0A9D4CI01_DREPO|nr:hypothetical protein DPMN_050680 [Dreissena polymorpha]
MLTSILSWFKKKNVEADVAGCPKKYLGLPVSVLEFKTRLVLAEYLDNKGQLVHVELDNIPMDILNYFTGLAKLAGLEDCLETVDFKLGITVLASVVLFFLVPLLQTCNTSRNIS